MGWAPGWGPRGRSMPRLLVIQHLEREGPGLFAEAAAARGWTLQVVRPDQDEPFPPVATGDVVLVLGGLGALVLLVGFHITGGLKG